LRFAARACGVGAQLRIDRAGRLAAWLRVVAPASRMMRRVAFAANGPPAPVRTSIQE